MIIILVDKKNNKNILNILWFYFSFQYNIQLNTQMIYFNPECQTFEIIAKMKTAPACLPFEYDEGVASQEYCIKRCMDLPGCLSLLYSLETRNCTYHVCAEFEDAANSSNEDILFIKNCLEENWKSIAICLFTKTFKNHKIIK